MNERDVKRGRGEIALGERARPLPRLYRCSTPTCRGFIYIHPPQPCGPSPGAGFYSAPAEGEAA